MCTIPLITRRSSTRCAPLRPRGIRRLDPRPFPIRKPIQRLAHPSLHRWKLESQISPAENPLIGYRPRRAANNGVAFNRNFRRQKLRTSWLDQAAADEPAADRHRDAPECARLIPPPPACDRAGCATCRGRGRVMPRLSPVGEASCRKRKPAARPSDLSTGHIRDTNCGHRL